jgi:uncharacterized protein YndB with AHSA1/START domain
MLDPVAPLPCFSCRSGIVRVQIHRRFEASPERLWRALTDPADLLQWLAPGTIGLKVGERAQLDFADSGIAIDSVVTAIDPGRLLEYGWNGPSEPARPLRWDITPNDDFLLTLTLEHPAHEDAARPAAGRTAQLEMLAAALADVPIRFPFAVFKAARELYRQPVADAIAV